MNIHKNAKTTPKMRGLIVAARQAGETPDRIASALGVSAVTVRKWLARHAAAGEAGLTDRSSRPRQLQTRARDGQRADVEVLRRARQPFWSEGMTATGPKECPNAASVGLSRATVARVGKSCGLSHLSALSPKPEIIRYEKDTPGAMIHTDIKKLGRIEGIGHRITPSRRLQAIACRAMGDRTGQSNPRGRKAGGKGWEYQHLAVDDHSRLAYSEIFPDETRKSCLRFLFNALRFFRSHGVKVWRVMTEFEGSGNDPGDHFPAERGELPIKALRQGIENAKDKAQVHQARYAQNQRKGLTLAAASNRWRLAARHPDFPARMGLCHALHPLGRPQRRPLAIHPHLQPSSPTLRHQWQNPNLEDRQKQPIET